MQFWKNLSDRERFLIAAAAVLLAIVVVVAGVVSPIVNWRADQQQALNQARGVYELVTQAGARGRVGASASQTSAPMRNVMTQSASAAGVSLGYVNVRQDGAVETNASPIDPAILFAWMQSLEREYGARVISADIAREQMESTLDLPNEPHPMGGDSPFEIEGR